MECLELFLKDDSRLAFVLLWSDQHVGVITRILLVTKGVEVEIDETFYCSLLTQSTEAVEYTDCIPAEG